MLAALVQAASRVVGNNTVKKEIATIIADAESKPGENLYVPCYRLGVHNCNLPVRRTQPMTLETLREPITMSMKPTIKKLS